MRSEGASTSVTFTIPSPPLPTSPQGPLNITVQELDGFYTHTVQVEELSSTYELPCHSKIRKCVKEGACVCMCVLVLYAAMRIVHVVGSCYLGAGARNGRCLSAVGKRWRWICHRLSTFDVEQSCCVFNRLGPYRSIFTYTVRAFA